MELWSDSPVIKQQKDSSDEYTASRDNSPEQSMAALQVASMNQETAAWTQAQAPDVLKEST